jgi:hypothetical protein
MSVLVSTGLSDLSKELGETTTNSTARRVGHYGDAVVEFANAHKWPFLVKKSTTLVTIANTKVYAIPAGVLAEMRKPGGIKAIYVGSGVDAFLPIDYDQRGAASLQGKQFFYLDLEETSIGFIKDLGAAGQTITLYYYYIPARITDTADVVGYPIPERYRKIVATLAAAYVQWSRYLESQGNRLFNVYQRMLGEVSGQQAERNTGKPKRLQHPLEYRGFRRTYR